MLTVQRGSTPDGAWGPRTAPPLPSPRHSRRAVLRTRAITTSDFEAELPSPRPSPIGWERENRVPRQLAYPAVVEGARDESGCSLSRRTGEGQGEGHFVRNTPPVRHLFLHRP